MITIISVLVANVNYKFPLSTHPWKSLCSSVHVKGGFSKNSGVFQLAKMGPFWRCYVTVRQLPFPAALLDMIVSRCVALRVLIRNLVKYVLTATDLTGEAGRRSAGRRARA